MTPLLALAEYEAHLATPRAEWKAAGYRAETWAGAESHQTRYRRFILTGEWGDTERQGA